MGPTPRSPKASTTKPGTLEPCADATAANWIIGSELPWHQLLSFGPAGFPAYARIRFIPDPVRNGQPENEAGGPRSELSETERLNIAVGLLRQYTSTPGELFYAFWDGYGFTLPAARFEVPGREFYLYRGCPAGDGSWDMAAQHQAQGQSWMPVPAFIWPADHSWCIAYDVDPHWTGLGADTDAVAALVADSRLDAVRAEPAQQQPFYL